MNYAEAIMLIIVGLAILFAVGLIHLESRITKLEDKQNG